jgi:hypothetical protein
MEELDFHPKWIPLKQQVDKFVTQFHKQRALSESWVYFDIYLTRRTSSETESIETVDSEQSSSSNSESDQEYNIGEEINISESELQDSLVEESLMEDFQVNFPRKNSRNSEIEKIVKNLHNRKQDSIDLTANSQAMSQVHKISLIHVIRIWIGWLVHKKRKFREKAANQNEELKEKENNLLFRIGEKIIDRRILMEAFLIIILSFLQHRMIFLVIIGSENSLNQTSNFL